VLPWRGSIEVLAVGGDAGRPVELAGVAGRQLPLAVLDLADRLGILQDQRQQHPLAIALGERADLTDRQLLPVLGRDAVPGVMQRDRRVGERLQRAGGEHVVGRAVDAHGRAVRLADLISGVDLHAGAHAARLGDQVAILGPARSRDGHGVGEFHVNFLRLRGGRAEPIFPSARERLGRKLKDCSGRA